MLLRVHNNSVVKLSTTNLQSQVAKRSTTNIQDAHKVMWSDVLERRSQRYVIKQQYTCIYTPETTIQTSFR